MTRSTSAGASAPGAVPAAADVVPASATPGTPLTLASAPLPFKATDAAALPTAPQWGAAILLCLAALVAGIVALRRRGHANTWRRAVGLLQVIETRTVGAHAQLAVVRYQGRQLLLSIGPGGTQCLRDDPAASEASP